MADYSIPTDREIAEKARALILADLRCYDSAAVLARKTGTNTYTLKRAFRKYFQESVFDFSRRVRIGRARELLTGTNYTLQTIAEMVGYTEGINFQTALKAVVGCTPGSGEGNHGTLINRC